MKKYCLILLGICSFLSSCENEPTALEEKQAIKAVGKTYPLDRDSIEVIPIEPGPMVPKEVYEVSRRPFSLDPMDGKEVISTITADDGLPLKNFQVLKSSSNGNLWLIDSFINNLYRYDGKEFDSFSLSDNYSYYIQDLAIDENDHIWILIVETSDSGSFTFQLLVLDGYQVKEIEKYRLTFENQITFFPLNLFEGANNSIWIVDNLNHEIFLYHGQKLAAAYNSSDFIFQSIESITDLGEKGTYFFDQQEQKVSYLFNGEFSEINIKETLPNSRVFNFSPITQFEYYLGTSTGTYYIKEGRATLIKGNLRTNNFITTSDGTLWAGSIGEVFKVNGISTKNVAEETEIENLENFKLNKDQEENIWVSGQSFVGKFDQTISTFSDLLGDNSSGRSFREIFQSRSGDYYFGTFLNGLLHFDGENLANYSFEKARVSGYQSKNNINSIQADNEGNIWFTVIGGFLYKFDGDAFQEFPINPFFSEIIGIDSDGIIWLNESRTRNLISFDGQALTKQKLPEDINSNFLTSMVKDPDGTVWIGTDQGLIKLKDEVFTHFTIEDGLPNNYINTLTQGASGNLWIGTDKGLSIFNEGRFTNYSTEDGLYDEIITEILSDGSSNRYWITDFASNRLTRVELDSLTPNGLKVQSFSKAEGFPIPAGSSFFVDDKGVIWISLPNASLARFDVTKVDKNSKAFSIHLNQILLNGEPVLWSPFHPKYSTDSAVLHTEVFHLYGKQLDSQEIEASIEQFNRISYDSLIPFDFVPVGLKLPFSANSIRFEFAAIDPLFSKNTRYKYYLQGFDKAWSPLEKSSFANYGNLQEGEYSLQIRALNSYGIWSEMEYHFTILPPWYRTWWAYLSYLFLFLIVIFGFIRWRTQKLKEEKAILEKEVSNRTSELEQSLENLKSTQAQLIQSEKMASLGELTAGIAHEIQNPLNFVNNFSELNKELVEEATEELEKGDLEETKAILKDLGENSEKINHHGKRAGAIVKGMLEHSRSNTGEKSETDLNALADEYVRLSYHGLRAKDKSFNADFTLDLDPNLPKVNVVASDIGRVLLNLINNAFYAVDEKAKSLNVSPEYKPIVTVSSTYSPFESLSRDIGRGEGSIQISVKDNGGGIPEQVRDKIFQPFFTTKPTGSGTGLGLSLSYDIVKAHGGELRVWSEEGKGTKFTLHIPIS